MEETKIALKNITCTMCDGTGQLHYGGKLDSCWVCCGDGKEVSLYTIEEATNLIYSQDEEIQRLKKQLSEQQVSVSLTPSEPETDVSKMKEDIEVLTKNISESACPNCGGKWMHIGYKNYDYGCDSCCMNLVDGQLISRDCECTNSHKQRLKYKVEVDGRVLNAVEQALYEYKRDTGVDPLKEKFFEAIGIVERLYDERLIPYTSYEIFITEERNCGSISCTIKEGNFVFNEIDCSIFGQSHLPQTPEDEAFFNIYSVTNSLLRS